MVFPLTERRRIVDACAAMVLVANGRCVAHEPPTVGCVFTGGVTRGIQEELLRRGVRVYGTVLEVEAGGSVPYDVERVRIASKDDLAASLQRTGGASRAGVPRLLHGTGGREHVNLDVTCLIVLCADVTNGYCNPEHFRDPLLKQVAVEERACRALPALKTYLEGKRMMVCRTARDSFATIIRLVGGPREKERATVGGAAYVGRPCVSRAGRVVCWKSSQET